MIVRETFFTWFIGTDKKGKQKIKMPVLNNTTLRVHIHANHEFTNFGKAFEFNFRYDGAKFIKI
jgi:hypothetical protein